MSSDERNERCGTRVKVLERFRRIWVHLLRFEVEIPV